MATLRNPEYTGENRCLPCTGVNLGIALVLTVLSFVFLSMLVSTAMAALTAISVFIIATFVIWAWGYLVPGTPTLTQRYLPDRVHAWFGHEPPTLADDGSIDLEHLFLDADLLEPCVEEDDLCLRDEVAHDLQDVVDSLDGKPDPDRFVTAIGMDGSDLDVFEQRNAVMLTVDGRHVASWPSSTALLADSAIAHVISDRLPTWDSLSTEDRARAITGLRVFLDECPDGGGAVTIRSETVSSCCSEHEVVAAVCEDSGERLFEQQLA